MKCAFINLGKHFGGAENYLLTIISAWIAIGNEAIVIVKENSVFAERIRALKYQIEICEVNLSIGDARRVRKFFTNLKIDIVDINGINSGLFMEMIGLKLPRVTTVHSNADMDRANRSYIIRKMFVELENICLAKSSKIIVVSEAIRDLLISRNIDETKIVVIHNGVRMLKYSKKEYREEKSSPLKICFIGRLEKVKGCECLIRALGEIKDLNFRCDIYGDGSLKVELKDIVRRCGIDSKIIFKGFSDNVREVLKEYDVIVQPSLYEAFPLTIPEAMNARTLLIYSEVGGIPFIIKDGQNGYLFNCGDAQHLATVLKDVYANPQKQIRVVENAYNDFINKYTEEVMTLKTFQVLKEVASQ